MGDLQEVGGYAIFSEGKFIGIIKRHKPGSDLWEAKLVGEAEYVLVGMKDDAVKYVIERSIG